MIDPRFGWVVWIVGLYCATAMRQPFQTPRLEPSWSRVLAVLWGSFGFVALRLLLTPIRIKLLTTLLPRDVYGGLMLISTTVAFASLALSFGAFEFLFRRLPGRPPAEQARLLRTVLVGLATIGVPTALGGSFVLWRWSPSKLPPDLARFPFAAPLLVAAMLMLLACVFTLLATHRYGRARWLQIFASDLWFLPVAVMAALGRIHAGAVLLGWVLWVCVGATWGLAWTMPVGWYRANTELTYLRDWFAFGLPFMPMVLGDWLFRLIDQYVVLAIRDVHTLAAYALAVNIAMVGYFAGTAALDLLIAEFYRRHNARSQTDGVPPNDIREIVTVMVRIALAVGIATAAVLLTTGHPLVRLLSSARYDDAARLLRWTAALPLAFLFVLIGGRLRAALGHTWQVGALTLAAALLALVLNLWFVPHWGGVGAALANTAALTALAMALLGPLGMQQWIDWSELRLGRAALAAGLTALALIVWRQSVPSVGAGLDVLATVSICAIAILATGWIRGSDLALLSGSPQNPSHE